MDDNILGAVNKPLVSVYCMTYNQNKTIGQTIESIVSQKTDFKFEIILHDDASTDGTDDIVRHYAELYPDIIRPIYQKVNQFHSCNIFKEHIHPVSRGEFIAICDGDDYWTSPDKLQLQADYMRENIDCTLCFHAVSQLYPDGKTMDIRPLKSDCDVPADIVIKRGGLFCPTVASMFRRNVMDIWPEFRCVADIYDYPSQVLAASMGKVHYIDKSMGVYRFASSGSWTAQRENKVDYKHLENEMQWLEMFNDYTDHKFTAAIDYHIAHLWFTEYRKTVDKNIKKTAKQKIKKLDFKDRLIFNITIMFFSVFGKSANKLWQTLKKCLLK